MKKISITQIAKKSGVNQSTISNILGGRRRPSWSLAKKLAETTQTDPILWLDGSIEEIRSAIQEKAING